MSRVLGRSLSGKSDTFSSLMLLLVKILCCNSLFKLSYVYSSCFMLHSLQVKQGEKQSHSTLAPEFQPLMTFLILTGSLIQLTLRLVALGGFPTSNLPQRWRFLSSTQHTINIWWQHDWIRHLGGESELGATASKMESKIATSNDTTASFSYIII